MHAIIHYTRKTMYLPILILVMFIIAFGVDTPREIMIGYGKILVSNSISVTDYLAIGGLGATIINMITLMIVHLVLLRVLKLRMSGIIYAGMMMLFGFAFYGKNLLNVLPICVGIYLYSKVNKVEFKNLIVALLFSSGISPLVSYTMFGFELNLGLSIPLGILAGLVSGFILPPLASHTMKFHQGYSVFNIGFALGLISIFFNAIYRALGMTIQTVDILNEQYHWLLTFILLGFSVFYIIMAFIGEPKFYQKLKLLYKRSGRLISDYERDYGIELVIFNTATIIILQVAVVLLCKIRMDGVIFGSILATAGFAGAGLHLKNTIPVLIGALLSATITGYDITSTTIIISVLFSLGLAPIAGRYGLLAGMTAGFLHLLLARITVPFQGGFVLYNNGFASCFVACVMIAVIEALKEDK